LLVVPREAPQSRAESRRAPYRYSNAPMPRTRWPAPRRPG
jgi:hypothetical protein